MVVTMTTNDQSQQDTSTDETMDMDYVPIIGIQANSANLRVRKYGSEFVRSEYVRFLQMGGADVVVIETSDQSNHSSSNLFNKINGVFFTGGGADLFYSAFAKSATKMMESAKDANDAGDYFPVLGTCLGIQFMVSLEAGKHVVDETDSTNLSVPLILSPTYKESSMFGQTPPHLMEYLRQENITANFHKKSLLLKTFNETEEINKFYRLLSTNLDRNGVEFVSTIEAYKYPFYGIQWHPEKPMFLKHPGLDISRSSHAIQVGQHMANFFVDQARKSKHRVTEEERSRMVLEYNHSSYCLPRRALTDMCAVCHCCIVPPNTWSVVMVTAIVTILVCLLLSFLSAHWSVGFLQHRKNN